MGFCYQKNFSNPTLPVDEAQFWALVKASKWNDNIDKYRETGDAALKRKLPAFIFQATFDETTSAKGRLGAWRKQAATRLTCVPLPATNFKMMSRESNVDYDSDNRLKEWAKKLDRTKGELSVQKLVDELYDWTARRMADAEENDSKADEMLLKRCAYHGLNFSAPFIVMRHWGDLHQEGNYWCGTFETDEIDWRLAELIVNIQYACQRYYFGAMAEAYFDNKLKDASVNVQRRKKTYEGFDRLPDEFTIDDVIRSFKLNNNSAARSRVFRMQRDRLIEKSGEYVENGTTKAKYKKTGVAML